MITYQIESLTSGLEEMKSMFVGHYEELALNQDKVPLDPQYDIYMARDARGEVIYSTVREDGQLVGYYVGFIAPGLHYRTCLTCTTDIFYVAPHLRTGFCGIKLFREVQRELKRRGVQRWFMGSKQRADASALFERLKAEKVETYYSLWLGN